MKLNYMKVINTVNFKLRSLATTLLLSFALALFGNATQVLAHGGEDHGEAKPATATTTAGTVTRSVRLGDFEIMLKHSPPEPDKATAGRFFVTRFATNEPVGDANPAIEIESATGAVTEIPIEKTDAVGSYTVKIPALPEGTYAIRTKAATGSGKTDTATFSGVEVAHQEAAAADAGSSSWWQTALMAMLFLVALALFGGLAYFAVRVFKNKPLGETTVSA
jgi:hypothetical protein